MEKQKLIGFLVLLIILSLGECRNLKKSVTLKQLTTLSQTVYLTKYDFGSDEGNVILKYRKFGQYFPDGLNIRVGLLVQQNYGAHKSAQTCYEKETFYREIQTLKYFDQRQGIQFLKINKGQQKYRWFVFLYTCDWVDLFNDGSTDGLTFDIVLNSQGMSKYGQFSIVVWPYTILFILWIVSLVKLLNPIQTVLKTRNNIAAVFLSIGYLLLGIAICLKYLSMMSAILTGSQIQIFDAIYTVFKSSIEVIMATMLTSIAWGWLLNNQNLKKHYLITISTVTFLNILSVIIVYTNEDDTAEQHLYQGFTGKIVLFIRILISLIFVSGCLYISFQCSEKNKPFIRNFAQIGFIYLFSGLIALILVQIIVPAYLHGQAINITQQMIRMIANIALCWLFAFPSSNKEKINKKLSDVFYGNQQEEDFEKICADKSHLSYTGKRIDQI